MSSIPLEDGAVDVLAKAQKGLKLSDEQLCHRAAISQHDLEAIRDGATNPQLISKCARALELDSEALLRLAEGIGPAPVDPIDGLAIFPAPYPEGNTVNSYLVWDPEALNGACFDAGGDCESLLTFAAEREIRVQMILLTHSHETHTRGLNLLVSRLGAQFFISKLESLPGATIFEAGRNFRAGKLVIGTKPTPGHSRASDSYVVSGLSKLLVFTGDVLFAGSMGAPNYSYPEALRSACEKILTLPLDTIICPGHGPLTTVAEERLHNPFFPELRPLHTALAA